MDAPSSHRPTSQGSSLREIGVGARSGSGSEVKQEAHVWKWARTPRYTTTDTVLAPGRTRIRGHPTFSRFSDPR
jgi:hypothetical protein